MSELINQSYYYLVMLSGYVLTTIACFFTLKGYFKAKKESEYLRAIFKVIYQQAQGFKEAATSLAMQSENSNDEAMKMGAKLLFIHAKTFVNAAWSYCETLAITKKEHDEIQKRIKAKSEKVT